MADTGHLRAERPWDAGQNDCRCVPLSSRILAIFNQTTLFAVGSKGWMNPLNGRLDSVMLQRASTRPLTALAAGYTEYMKSC